jgi:hypothetical protein
MAGLLPLISGAMPVLYLFELVDILLLTGCVDDELCHSLVSNLQVSL